MMLHATMRSVAAQLHSMFPGQTLTAPPLWMTVPSNSNCERPCFYCSLSRLQEQYSMHEIGSKACPQPFVKVGGYPCCQGPSHAWPFFWWSSFAACSHCPAGGGESESEAALPRQNPGPVIASASLRSQCRWHTIGFPSLSLSLSLSLFL